MKFKPILRRPLTAHERHSFSSIVFVLPVVLCLQFAIGCSPCGSDKKANALQPVTTCTKGEKAPVSKCKPVLARVRCYE